MRIFVFLIFLGTITFSNQAWATSLVSDSVTATSSNFGGTVTRVIDGDTLDLTTIEGETITIRLALIDAPETEESGFDRAKNFMTELCLNKNAEIDPDNNQGLSYGRIVAAVYCEGTNVNEAILENGFAGIYQDFCDVSEFADANWAQEYGCSNKINNETGNENDDPVESGDINNNQFDIDSSSKDLDCKDFEEKNFSVGSDDPHNLDADGDGIGCET
jgi:micrococcal nuclease